MNKEWSEKHKLVQKCLNNRASFATAIENLLQIRVTIMTH